MPALGTIIVAEGNDRLADLIAMNLEARGFAVQRASNGADALSIARETTPDLVIADAHLDDTSGGALAEKLRSQERLGSVPFLFIADRGERIATTDEDAVFTRPLDFWDLLSRVESHVKSRAAAGHAARQVTIAGQLSEIGLLDLLQVLEMSRRTGVLAVRRGALEGRLYMKEGRLWQAATRDLRGEDAAYTLLEWRHGEFTFTRIPEEDFPEQGITTGVAGILMEGMRLLDEKAVVAEHLPEMSDVLAVADPSRAPDDDAGLKSVLSSADGSRTAIEIVDHARAGWTRGRVLLGKLIAAGALKAVAAPSPDPSRPEGADAWRRRLAERFGRMHPQSSATLKIVVLGPEGAGVSTFLRTLKLMLPERPGAPPASGVEATDFHRVELSPTLSLYFLGFRGERSFAEMWRGLLTNARAAVYVMDGSDASTWDHAQHFLDFARASFPRPVVMLVNRVDRDDDPVIGAAKAFFTGARPPVSAVQAVDQLHVRRAVEAVLDAMATSS